MRTELGVDPPLDIGSNNLQDANTSNIANTLYI